MVGEHHAQQCDRAHVGLLGGAVVEVTGAAQVLHQSLADRVGVLAVAVREVLRRPGVGLARELEVPVVEKRPLQMREAVHAPQSPSNTGFCFDANAW